MLYTMEKCIKEKKFGILQELRKKLFWKTSPNIILFTLPTGEDIKTASSKNLASNISKLIFDTTSLMQIPEPILRIFNVSGDQQNGEISVTQERKDIILMPTCQSSCGEGKYPLVSNHLTL